MSLQIRRTALFSRLNSLSYKSLEGATVLCKLRGNPQVEVVHWFNQILNEQDSDIHHIVRAFGIDAGRIAGDLQAAMEALPTGSNDVADLSGAVDELAKEAWLQCSLAQGAMAIRTGHLILAICGTDTLQPEMEQLSDQFRMIDVNRLAEEFDQILKASPETGDAAPASAVGEAMPGESSGAIEVESPDVTVTAAAVEFESALFTVE